MAVPSDATEEVIENLREGYFVSAGQWVVVHEAANGREYRLNIDHIVGVSTNRDGKTVVYLTTRSDLIVDEALDEIAPLHE